MKYLMMICCMSLILTSCDKKGQHRTPPPEVDSSMINEENPAEITFKESTYDFGEIAQGEKVVKEFEFTNTGKSPLKIVDARSTCGCTVPSYPEEFIQPGESGKIKVVFNSYMKQGDISKTVIIRANTHPIRETEIYIKGRVAV